MTPCLVSGASLAQRGYFRGVQQNPQQQRVDFHDPLLKAIGVDAGGSDIWAYAGQRFTGVIEDRRGDGTLRSEFELMDGHPHGANREYYPNGQMKVEYFMSYNRPYGFYREWNDQGVLITEEDRGKEFEP